MFALISAVAVLISFAAVVIASALLLLLASSVYAASILLFTVANAVAEYLLSKGVAPEQLKTVEGKGSKEPVADNGTSEGRAENRRVEIYLYASEAMIDAANNGALE